jgi:hypothetical protein
LQALHGVLFGADSRVTDEALLACHMVGISPEDLSKPGRTQQHKIKLVTQAVHENRHQERP